MFSCKFCKIFKNTYFYRTPLVADLKKVMSVPGGLRCVHLLLLQVNGNFKKKDLSFQEKKTNYSCRKVKLVVLCCFMNFLNVDQLYYKIVYLFEWHDYKSSHLQMFYKICVVRNFAKFTGKHLFRSLFLVKLLARLYWKKYSGTSVFLEFCGTCKNTFFNTN